MRQIVASIRHILSTAFSRGAHQYFFSTLGAELGPLRTELETLTGLKLRSFLEQKFAAEIVPASDSNAALVLRRDVLDALDAADPHLRSVELPHLDEIPVSNCEAPEEAADTAAHGGLPRYRGGVWSAFVMPLDADKVRYLSTRTFTFFDIAAEDPVPSQVAEVKREMICPQDALDKPQRVQTSIFAWAESAKVDSKMLEVQPRKAGGHKQNPIYPWTSTNIIEPILTDSARYKKPEDALRLLESIRERFTCKKVASGEVREDHDYLWIFNYALTQDQQRRGEKGNYARLYIEKVGSRWHVRAEPVRDHDGWGAPAQPNRWQNKDHPNWSIRTLRKLQRGPMFFDSEDEARAEMDWLVDTFPKVLRFSDNKIGCMVYKRGPGGKGVAFDKVQIRLAYDQSDRPYLYMDWMFAEKHRAAQILAQPAREHSAKAVDGVIGSMFNAENEIEHRVAGHAARELLNWEGRGKYKASAVSGANHLYHYTSLQAMDAILEHRQAWLTDLRYMNDMSEIFHGHSVLTGFFANYASIVADVDGQPDKRRTAILAEAERLIAAKPIDDTIYALCLTDNVEVAAQWLTYGYHGSGVALGFDRDALADAAAAGGLGLRRVHYHPDRKANIVHNVVKSILDDSTLVSVAKEELAAAMASVLRSMSSIFKHDSFYTEKEWRLIKRDDGDGDRWPVEQRPKGGSGVGLSATYVTLDFSKHLNIELRDVLRSIYVGPGPGQEERKRSIQGTLRRLKLDDVEVIVSQIPLGMF